MAYVKMIQILSFETTPAEFESIGAGSRGLSLTNLALRVKSILTSKMKCPEDFVSWWRLIIFINVKGGDYDVYFKIYGILS